MASGKSKKLLILGFFIFFILGLSYIFFNDNGIIKYVKLKNQIDTLNHKIEDITKENNNLQGEIDSLKDKVPAKIERIAREKYNMIRKGEKVIKIKEK